jgi:pimeloyl-ACP methyl ester carboxylesterase
MRVLFGLISFFVLGILGFILISSKTQNDKQLNISIEKGPKLYETSYSKFYGKTKVQVFFLASKKHVKNKGLILLLPGWNFPVLDWKFKTKVCQRATELGYHVLLVDMGKSVYLDSVYNSCRADYTTYPTRRWLWDSVLSPYKKTGFFIPESRTFVLGLSTGARGAALLGLEHGSDIKAVGCLSGDYAPNFDTTDLLFKNTLGPYWKYPDRWVSGSNNILHNISKWTIPVYMSHGLQDKIVSVKHSISFRDSLLKRPQIKSKFDIDPGHHDYQFWNDHGLKALAFFDTL